MTDIRLSIVVATTGRASLVELVRSIAEAGADERDELVLVLNNARAGWPAGLAELPTRFRIRRDELTTENPPSYAAASEARNLGMMHASGTHLVFADDDDVYLPGALELVRGRVAKEPDAMHVFQAYTSSGRLISGEIKPGEVATWSFAVPRNVSARWPDDHLGPGVDFGFVKKLDRVFGSLVRHHPIAIYEHRESAGARSWAAASSPARRWLLWTAENRPASAGVVATWQLSRKLAAIGELAELRSTRGALPDGLAEGREVTPSTIAVYPSSVAGNPWGASFVCRWFLDRELAPERAAAPDLVVYYHPAFRSAAAAAAAHELEADHLVRVATIDPADFRGASTRARDLDLVYVGKAKKLEAPWPSGDRWTHAHAVVTPWYPESRAETLSLLSRARRLYSFDDSTMMLDEAIAAGVDPFVPDGAGGWTRAPHGPVDLESAWNDLEPARRLVRAAAARWPFLPGPVGDAREAWSKVPKAVKRRASTFVAAMPRRAGA